MYAAVKREDVAIKALWLASHTTVSPAALDPELPPCLLLPQRPHPVLKLAVCGGRHGACLATAYVIRAARAAGVGAELEGVVGIADLARCVERG
jgi:hypothetical protein